MSSGFFENNTTYKLFFMYMYKQDLALNNLQGLICHKTQLYSSILVNFCNTKIRAHLFK